MHDFHTSLKFLKSVCANPEMSNELNGKTIALRQLKVYMGLLKYEWCLTVPSSLCQQNATTITLTAFANIAKLNIIILDSSETD